MKRILAIVFLMAFILVNVSKAQTPEVFQPKQWELKHLCKDTLKLSTTTWTYAVKPNKTDALFSFSNLSLSRTSTTDTVNMTILIQGKYSSLVTDTNYVTLGIATFTGTQIDSLISCPLFTTKLGYQVYRHKVIRNSGSVRVNSSGWIFRK